MPYDPGEDFTISSGYGARIINGSEDNHTGIDYGAESGADIPAASDGEVWYYGENDAGYGNTVILRHTGADGSYYYTLYAHMEPIREDAFQLGQQVDAGDTIGQVGTSGLRPGSRSHLHYEIIEGITPRRTDGGRAIGIPKDTYRVDPDTFDNWSSSGAYDGSQSSDSDYSDGMAMIERNLSGYPREIIDQAKEGFKNDMEKSRKKSSGSSSSGETLERRGKKVWRVEGDGTSRGYVVPWSE